MPGKHKRPCSAGPCDATIHAMEIARGCVVALTWTLQDSLGETLDELLEPVEFLVGGTDLLPALEEALLGRAAGANLDLHLEPEQAFGEYDERLVFLLPRTALPAGIEEGLLIEGSALPADATPGAPAETVYTISGIYPDHVVLDGNHPLAGIGLRLQLQVARVRGATPDEIRNRSAGSSFFRLQPATPRSPGARQA